jgi:hypothetical protein
LGDVAELYETPFGTKTILCTDPERPAAWDQHGAWKLGAGAAVMLLDCESLPWDINDIVRGLDEDRYTYEELMSDLCLVPPDRIARDLPPEWNHLERYEPDRTKLIHFTVVPTQPWKSDENPLGEIWMSWYREAVEAGAVAPEEVEALITAGHVKPSLSAALPTAPIRRSVLSGASLQVSTLQYKVAELETRLANIEQSWSWKIGNTLVRTLEVPRRLLGRRPLASVRRRSEV